MVRALGRGLVPGGLAGGLAAAVLCFCLATSVACAQGAGSVAYAQGAGAQAGAFASLPAKQILKTALGAAKASGSARVVTTSRTGSQSGIFSNDSASQSGRQTIQVGPAVTNILVTADKTAYVEGNPQGLSQSLGVPSSLGNELSNTWISMKPGNPGYSPIEVGVTLPSVLQEVSPQTSLTKTKVLTVQGQRVVGVHGDQTVQGQKGVATLYVAAAGDHLPVSARSKSKKTTTSATFSNWGEPVVVTAPADSIPITTIIQGGNGSGSSGGSVTTAEVAKPGLPAVVADYRRDSS